MIIRIPIGFLIPKSSKGLNTLCIVLLSLFLFASSIFFISGIVGNVDDRSKNVVDISSLPTESIRTTDEYYIDSLKVIDSYAVSETDTKVAGPSTINSRYLLVAFPNIDEEICYASLEITPSDPMYNDIVSHLVDEDDTNFPNISGCFHCEKITKLDDDLVGWYHEASDDMNKLISGNTLDFNFVYDAKDPDAFATMETNKNNGLWIAGLVGIILFGTLMVIAVRVRIKIKRKAAQLANQQYGMYANQYSNVPAGSYSNTQNFNMPIQQSPTINNSPNNEVYPLSESMPMYPNTEQFIICENCKSQFSARESICPYCGYKRM